MIAGRERHQDNTLKQDAGSGIADFCFRSDGLMDLSQQTETLTSPVLSKAWWRR